MEYIVFFTIFGDKNKKATKETESKLKVEKRIKEANV